MSGQPDPDADDPSDPGWGGSPGDGRAGRPARPGGSGGAGWNGGAGGKGGLRARLKRVRASGDRRATSGLLELLRDADLDIRSLDALCSTLTSLEDLRAVPALESLLSDRTQSPIRREVALEILAGLPRTDPPPAQVRAWVVDPDPILRAHGATFLDAPDADLLAPLFHDPHAVVRRAAARSLMGLVRTPLLVGATKRALADDDPVVREWACQAAYMDEPMPLLFDVARLLRDPEPAVRQAATDAIEEFPCVSAILALADVRYAREGVEVAKETAEADQALSALLGTVTRAVATCGSRVADRLARWMAPAAWLLERYAGRLDGEAMAVTTETARDGECARTFARPERPDVDLEQAREVLLDPDAPARAQRDLLTAFDWAESGPEGCHVLCRSEPVLDGFRTRRGLTSAFGDLACRGDEIARARLVDLAADDDSAVRHAAISSFVRVRDRAVLPAALDTLADERHRPLAGDVALSAVVALGDQDTAASAVRAELDRDDVDGLRLGAIHQAECLGLSSAIPSLERIVEAPVVAGVACHVASLRTLRGLGHSTVPDVTHLADLDHLDVQREMGAWGIRGARYG